MFGLSKASGASGNSASMTGSSPSFSGSGSRSSLVVLFTVVLVFIVFRPLVI